MKHLWIVIRRFFSGLSKEVVVFSFWGSDKCRQARLRRWPAVGATPFNGLVQGGRSNGWPAAQPRLPALVAPPKKKK